VEITVNDGMEEETEEEKEAGFILYSVVIGLILTFVSLIHHSREVYYWLDYSGGLPNYLGGASAYGFPFGWIVFGAPSIFLYPFDLAGFLFDIAFWTVVTYVILRYVAPNLRKLKSKVWTIKLG